MKSSVETLEAVPEAMRTEYEPVKDGKGFVLKLEGDHPAIVATVAQANTKISEYRENNIRLLKQAEDLTGKLKVFDGVDAAEYQALKTKSAELATKGVKDGSDLAKLLEAQLAPVLDKLKTFEARDVESRKALADKTLETSLISAGIAAGVKDEAITDFVTRGKQAFSLEGERVVAKQNGTPVFSRKRPGELLDVAEWAADLQAEAPHLYKPNKGANTPPGSGTGVPGATGTWDGSDTSLLANLKGIAGGKVVRA